MNDENGGGELHKKKDKGEELRLSCGLKIVGLLILQLKLVSLISI